MTSVISSESVILTTAMAVSGAFLLLSLSRIWNYSPTHHDSDSNSQSPNHISSNPLRSCLSSEGKRREKNKKKRVKFADNVNDEKNRKKISKEHNKFEVKEIPEIHRMPANRVALYHGILRDRDHRVEYSY